MSAVPISALFAHILVIQHRQQLPELVQWDANGRNEISYLYVSTTAAVDRWHHALGFEPNTQRALTLDSDTSEYSSHGMVLGWWVRLLCHMLADTPQPESDDVMAILAEVASLPPVGTDRWGTDRHAEMADVFPEPPLPDGVEGIPLGRVLDVQVPTGGVR